MYAWNVRSMVKPKMLFGIALAFSLGGCKPQLGEKRAGPGSSDANRVPVRDADATTLMQWGVVSLDETGRPKARIVAPMDVLPDATPGSAVLPICRSPLPADTEIGVMKCTEGSSAELALTAAHVHQECYTNQQVVAVEASKPVVLAGCSAATLAGYRFTPDVRLDVEPR